ncbi:MAG: Holliday junction branch migration protein RuvA [Lachnospiraceae bacterium]|nr:Holliday junction branch migration protein RuvA [Lachnospiraceae bacterium]
MIGYIKGEVAAIYDDRLILETGGIGYNIYMPASCLELIEGIGSNAKIYTYLCVRDDAMLLYGFLTKDDLDLYRLLISVGGIGPKGGLSLLSAMTADELKFAIMSGDVKQIAKAPGIGAKTAQRVIIDLKDKIDLVSEFEDRFTDPGRSSADSLSSVKEEAALALVALGYSQTDAYKAVKNAAGDDVETILKSALSVISQL